MIESFDDFCTWMYMIVDDICSDPLELDNYDSSSKISPRKGEVQCQSVEHLHPSLRPR